MHPQCLHACFKKAPCLTGISIHRQCVCRDDRHVSVRDDSESMLIIKAKEWNEENIRYGCTLLEKGTSLKLAAREVRLVGRAICSQC